MFEGQSVVITGGATGIGFALAKQIGAKGGKILIGEPRANRLEQAVAQLQGCGVTAISYPLDVTDEASIREFANFADAEFGHTDILLNNAGVGLPPGKMYRQSMSQVRDLFDVNVFGVWQCSVEFGARMVKRGEPARIYNVGSENSFFNAAPGMAAYIASKHAVRGLTEAMVEDFPDFIKIGLICPGFVKSELTPPPFGDLAMDTDEFAERVVAQIEADRFYIVTHSYNAARIKPVHQEIEDSYRLYAPRHDGDDVYDVRLLIEKSRR